jgi:hypothetical protein
MHWKTCREIFKRHGLTLMGYSDGKVFRCRVYHKRSGVLRLEENPLLMELTGMSETELDRLAQFYHLLAVFS